MGPNAPGDDGVDMVAAIKQRVAGGEYSVDSRAVAEAILTRRRESDPLQALCSQMLIAAQAAGRPAGELEALPGDNVP